MCFGCGADRGVDVFFLLWCQGVGDVLAGVEQGVEEFFAVVKGFGDVLAGRWSWLLTCSSLVSRASLTCLLGVGARCLRVLLWCQGRW